MKVKGWQTAVIVLGLLVGGVSIAYTLAGPGEPSLAHRYFLIDVESGEIFEVDSKRYLLTIPAVNPATQRISMVRVLKDEEGKWRVFERDRPLLDELDKGVKVQAVDAQTGEVVGAPKNPVPFKQ